MSKLGMLSLGLTGVMLVASAFFFVMAGNKGDLQIASNAVNIQDAPRHPVTEEMAERAKNLAESVASDFELPTSDGGEFHLLTELEAGPAVLIMTKDGCPCSIESQPFFTALAAHYGSAVTFIGVMDSDRVVADKYATGFGLPYRMAFTEDKEFFRSYQSKQSVFTYLINQDGTLAKVWPGYSRATLVELNDMLAEMTGMEHTEFANFEMAPEEMTSGCYFFTDVGASEPSW